MSFQDFKMDYQPNFTVHGKIVAVFRWSALLLLCLKECSKAEAKLKFFFFWLGELDVDIRGEEWNRGLVAVCVFLCAIWWRNVESAS